MKKTMIFAAAAAMMMQASPILASACAGCIAADVNVTIEIGSETVLNNRPVTVFDYNGDGKLTSDEVISAAHDIYYPGSSSAGMADGKIWGKGGSFITAVSDQNGKLRLNNSAEYEAGTAAPSYSDEVQNGDSIRCYAIALDTARYEFVPESANASFSAFEQLPAGFTATFGAYRHDPAKKDPEPVAGAEIVQNGKGTGIKTDQNGKVTVTFAYAGDYELGCNFKSVDPNAVTENDSYFFHIKDASLFRKVQCVVQKEENKTDLNAPLYVYDSDKNGSIDAKDAMYINTEVNYPVGNYPDKLFGESGSFNCIVTDSKKNTKYSGNTKNLSGAVSLAEGDTVYFILDTVKNSVAAQNTAFLSNKAADAPAEAAQTTTAAAVTTTASAETTTEAALTTTTAAAQTTSASTAASTTASSASTAKSSTSASAAKSGNVKTGDTTMPLIACAVGMLAGGVALTALRKKDADK